MKTIFSKKIDKTLTQTTLLNPHQRNKLAFKKAFKITACSAIALTISLIAVNYLEATSIEEKVTTVGALAKGPLAKTVLTFGTLFAAGAAAAKGSMAIAAGALLVGGTLSYYIGWIWNGNFGA